MSLETQLAALEQADLIRLAQAQPELEYLFRHALMQEAAYGSLLKQNRRVLHRTIGEAMESLYDDRTDELSPVLARHFAEAEQHAKALDYSIRAGDLAMRKYANAEAVMHYESALAMAEHARQRHDEAPTVALLEHIYLRRGRALELLGRYGDAVLNYTTMESLARERRDRPLELAALTARATIHSTPTPFFDAATARALSERALPLARELGDHAAEAKSLWSLMLTARFDGRLDESVAYGERSTAIAREHDLREQLAYTLNDSFSVYVTIGQAERGFAVLDEALGLWRELGNLPMLADSLNNLTQFEWFRGNYERALALAQEAQQISHMIGNAWGKAFSQGLVAFVLFERGEIENSLGTVNEVLRLGVESGFTISLIIGHQLHAMIYTLMGDFERAMSHARRATAEASARMQYLRSSGLAMEAYLYLLAGDMQAAQWVAEAQLTPGEPAVITMVIGMALHTFALAQGDAARALTIADNFLKIMEDYASYNFLAEGLLMRGRALRALGRLADAYDALAQARAKAQAAGSRRMLLPILLEGASLAAQMGRTADAQAFRREAREVIAYIADHAPPDLRATFLAQPHVRALVEAVNR